MLHWMDGGPYRFLVKLDAISHRARDSNSRMLAIQFKMSSKTHASRSGESVAGFRLRGVISFPNYDGRRSQSLQYRSRFSSMTSEFRKILENTIDPRTVVRKRKAAIKRVSLVPANSAVRPQIIAPSVIAPCERTIISALIRPRMEFGIAR